MLDPYDPLMHPPKLWSRTEVLGPERPVPKAPGVYAWYFDQFPPEIPSAGCHRHGAFTLLYVGISPKAPPMNGRRPSTQTVADRIRYHYRGNAAGSTLRLTLGCLLRDSLGLQLRRVGSGQRMTFAVGEHVLSAWMEQHAYVVWVTHATPWRMEEDLIRRLSLPLNLDQNQNHSFHAVLSAKRREAKALARTLAIIR